MAAKWYNARHRDESNAADIAALWSGDGGADTLRFA